MTGYVAIKTVHLACVALTWALFTLRGYWMISGSAAAKARWARVVPHLNDTVLLGAGVTMVAIAGYPFTHGWIAAKLAGLLAYILLGTIALKRGRTRGMRVAAFWAAEAVFFYIVAVALTRRPLVFF